MPSSARLHDLKFTFTPAGADDSVHSKAPLPRGGCLRSAQTGRVFEPILFFLFQKEKNGFNLPRRERVLCKTGSANRTAIASEEASSIPFPPGRRKLHIRSLLLPSQIVTVSLGHNLAIWNFTTPHAILMMADIFLPVNRSEIFSYILPVFLRFVNGAEAAVYFAGPQRRSALLRQLRDGTEAIALRAQLVNRCQRRVHRAFVQIVH